MLRNAITAMLVLAAAVTAGARQEQSPPPTVEPQKVSVTAHKYLFYPDRIEVKVGQPVELTFESEDTTHGFVCKDLGIAKVTFKKGEPATVKFTATKAGTYKFKCSHFCGFGHGKMKGVIVATD
jgi:cytochrome c oxidase subunit II